MRTAPQPPQPPQPQQPPQPRRRRRRRRQLQRCFHFLYFAECAAPFGFVVAVVGIVVVLVHRQPNSSG